MPGLEGWMNLKDAARRFAVKRERLRRAVLETRLVATRVGEEAR